jgi:hypothetical protein
MADNNYIIKPVESLHNIAGLTPVKQREERRRRQSRTNRRRGGKDPDLDEDESTTTDLIGAEQLINHNEERESTEGGPNESVNSETCTGESNDDENDRHSIDYCA